MSAPPLVHRASPPSSVLVRRAHVLDPRAGIDEPRDVLVRDGVVAELGEADVVYALRMQRERMKGSFVPSLREYAARFQIDGRRLGAGQILMHPGPVNRGVELAAEVIDSPQALIAEQVESGVVVRMAVLYELLAEAEVGPGPEADEGAGGAAPEPLAAGAEQRG